MPRIISDIQRQEMAIAFQNGLSLNDISIKFNFKRNTIIKHLKIILGISEFKRIEKDNTFKNSKNINIESEIKEFSKFKEKDKIQSSSKSLNNNEIIEDNLSPNHEFFELSPLNQNFDFEERKDLTSSPLEDFDFPPNVYMIVDKEIELNVSFIKDFPEYSFLPESDQLRKIIKLFSDKKAASLCCRKNQKVIKAPNGGVFKLTVPFLIKKGISRIIYEDYLLSI